MKFKCLRLLQSAVVVDPHLNVGHHESRGRKTVDRRFDAICDFSLQVFKEERPWKSDYEIALLFPQAFLVLA